MNSLNIGLSKIFSNDALVEKKTITTTWNFGIILLTPLVIYNVSTPTNPKKRVGLVGFFVRVTSKKKCWVGEF